MKIYKFTPETDRDNFVTTTDRKTAFIAINDDEHLAHHPRLPDWKEVSIREFNEDRETFQSFYNTKFISGYEPNEFVAFSPNVDHDKMSIALEFPAKNAGFIYKSGETYGVSETLRLKSVDAVYPEYKELYTNG